MDKKWIFLLIINIDTSDKLCRHLVGIERPSPPPRPPPLQSSISMASLGRASIAAQKDKGTQTQACMNGAQIHYSFLSLISSPPLMHPRGSIYSPSIGSEGSSQSVSKHMEGQRSSYSRLIEENSKYFIFGNIF